MLVEKKRKIKGKNIMNREKITHVTSDMTENKYKKNTGNKR